MLVLGTKISYFQQVNDFILWPSCFILSFHYIYGELHKLQENSVLSTEHSRSFRLCLSTSCGCHCVDTFLVIFILNMKLMEQQKQVFQTFFNMHYCEILLQYTHIEYKVSKFLNVGFGGKQNYFFCFCSYLLIFRTLCFFRKTIK